MEKLSAAGVWIREYGGYKTVEKIVYYEKGSTGYPVRLKNYQDMPERLYVKGNLPSDHRPAAAIVGARACSHYGREQARRYARELAAAGVQIISGLASGVDTAAHEGALEGNGTTFAVLGCGVNICYPKENFCLMRRILEEGGGVISEFHPGEPPLAWHFPKRNRVISAMADLVLVVEARKKSGSLITADFALEQGKSVFALPGRVSDSLSEGCNSLIAQGAGIAADPGILLEELGIHGLTETTYENGEGLSEKEKELMKFMKQGSRTPDEICAVSGWRIQEVSVLLIQLRLKGIVREEGKNHYVLRG